MAFPYESSKLLENPPFSCSTESLSKQPRMSQATEFPSNFLQGLEMALLAHGHLLPRPRYLWFKPSAARGRFVPLSQPCSGLCPAGQSHAPAPGSPVSLPCRRMSKVRCYVHAVASADDGVCLETRCSQMQGSGISGEGSPQPCLSLLPFSCSSAGDEIPGSRSDTAQLLLSFLIK